VVAIASGVAAGSLILTAFGLDSVIELASAGVLMWRLSVELRRGQAFSDNAERAASRAAGGLLFALAAYVTIAALWSLWTRQGEEFSWPGSSSPWLQFRPCATWRIAKSPSPKSLVAEPFEPTQWKRSRAAGSRWSWWSASPFNGPSARGGSMASARSRSWGCWSRRAVRLGLAKNAAAVSQGR
jgi:hypothetical protein